MMHRRAHLVPIAVALLGAALLAGCSTHRNPVGVAGDPEAGGASALSARASETGAPGTEHAGRAFYPLALGNHWSYRIATRFRSVNAAGEPVGEGIDVEESQERELVCEEAVGDLTYVVEETRATSGTERFTSWVRFRQDRAGLYERDVDVLTPPPCAPGDAGARMRRAGEGAEPDAMTARIETAVTDPARRAIALERWRLLRERLRGVSSSLALGAADHRVPAGGAVDGEITRLRYPLHPGAGWVIRDDPRFTARVQGLDIVRTRKGPVLAWRIRLDNEFLGPKDRVNLWVGRAGFARLAAHLEIEGTDANGEYLLTTVDTNEKLVDWDLSRPSRAVDHSPMEPVAAD